jgi:hypothetical protein
MNFLRPHSPTFNLDPEKNRKGVGGGEHKKITSIGYEIVNPDLKCALIHCRAGYVGTVCRVFYR